jgi:hypothetical protein
MSSPDQRQPRREFLGQIAASAIVMAGTACMPSLTAQSQEQPTPAPKQPTAQPTFKIPTHWDDSWVGRLTAKHKAVFDSPEIDDGGALGSATTYIQGARQALSAGETDVQTVIVIRHSAIPMAFNDAMWQKYDIGKQAKEKDPRNKTWVTHNPYLHDNGPATPADRMTPTLAWFASHGHILLGCNRAALGYAMSIAERVKADASAIYDELLANLVPGMILQPSGIYAVIRAQEVGCAFFRFA